MSRNPLSKEEAISRLYDTIKTKFEEDGVMQEMRCKLQTSMIAMMKGDSDNTPMVPRFKEAKSDMRLQMLHQLMLEYLHWHGFHYTAEMFAMESGNENVKPMRECLEGMLGAFEHRNLPILLEIVALLIDKKK